MQNQKLNFDQSLSFEDVSKLFSLPLSEAADILGVSVSVLKKLCNENGLERWPHRKYLAGKSIEEIKREAAKEKHKALRGSSPADMQKHITSKGSSALSSPGSAVKDKIPKSAAEMSKSQGSAQQLGSKTTYICRPHNVLASSLTAETSDGSDEFKYGFPSSGLSMSTNRWWGSDKDGNDVLTKDEQQNSSDVKDGCEPQVNDSCAMVCGENSDSPMQDSGDHEQVKVSLSIIRKHALDEGQEALQVGILKKYRADRLAKEEQILLRRLFQTS